MSAGRRRRRVEEEEHVNHERWLVSYSDMITVLMALFIVLFAISQVDQEKYIALSKSLAAGFGDGEVTVSTSTLDGSDGVLDGLRPQDLEARGEGTAGLVEADRGLGQQGKDPAPVASVDPQVLAAAQAEAAHLEEVRAALRAALLAQGLDSVVQMRIDERGLVLGLVADDVFFAPASAELTVTARQVLDVAAPTLVSLAEQVTIEGHANVLPVGGRYPTNWELSADRATQVLRHLVERDAMPPGRVSAVGYGDARPIAPGMDEASLAVNRRVDLVLLSDAPENVRALLPAVVAP
ncbi:OmpA/MotB family protein [Cellulomonas wangsupingiae]|uniref:Flagellar motor protein MotB n=1 Tax=Cellulomonas wangsupingiae TaxID=2968085 RepID=A0ABY5K650_9CELL|nr:flagellar motor protein MotB [Cellulomonas wangsupingiae]MCC2334161.1 flagellar motor protein MotB [Cellulomonas wangsupingiae]UUI65840.1 flagellar motor protein MotB [Cellulomonas wangsupingiae]